VSIEQYIEIRRSTPFEEVSFGFGYSVGDAGEDFTGENPGDWKRSWLVIAYEDSLGDPLFIDSSTPELPVFTAAHGEGEWNPTLVASSLSGFIEALKEVERVSKGRSNPIEAERNPLPDSERQRVLSKIAELNGSSSLEFWENWFEV
jgi:hypothetical protein